MWKACGTEVRTYWNWAFILEIWICVTWVPFIKDMKLPWKRKRKGHLSQISVRTQTAYDSSDGLVCQTLLTAQWVVHRGLCFCFGLNNRSPTSNKNSFLFRAIKDSVGFPTTTMSEQLCFYSSLVISSANHWKFPRVVSWHQGSKKKKILIVRPHDSSSPWQCLFCLFLFLILKEVLKYLSCRNKFYCC